MSFDKNAHEMLLLSVDQEFEALKKRCYAAAVNIAATVVAHDTTDFLRGYIHGAMAAAHAIEKLDKVINEDENKD